MLRTFPKSMVGKKSKQLQHQLAPRNDTTDKLEELFDLVDHHVIGKHEIYTLAQLVHCYNELVGDDDTYPTLRSIDLKEKLQERFGEKIKFGRPSQSRSDNTSEFVMSSAEILISDCITTSMLGGGIQHSIAIKNMSASIRREIQVWNEREQRKWPPTPQEVMKYDISNETNSLYNLIALIVSPY